MMDLGRKYAIDKDTEIDVLHYGLTPTEEQYLYGVVKMVSENIKQNRKGNKANG